MKAVRRFFGGVGAGMKLFGTCMSTVVNTVLMSIVYFFGVGLSALFARIGRKELLATEVGKQKTYWQSLRLRKKKTDDYYRQF